MNIPQVIAVGGPSCSGKSTLANSIVARLGRDRAACLSMDSYYRDLAKVPMEERGHYNFDSPNAFDWPLLLDHVMRLSHGIAVDVPCTTMLRTCVRQT